MGVLPSINATDADLEVGATKGILAAVNATDADLEVGATKASPLCSAVSTRSSGNPTWAAFLNNSIAILTIHS